MTIARVANGAPAATFASALGATYSTIAPALPAYSEGDLLLLLVGVRATNIVTIPAPSGWTEIKNCGGTNRQIYLFGKVAGASESAPTVDPVGENGTTQPPNAAPLMAQIVSFSGSFSLTTLEDLLSASINPAPWPMTRSRAVARARKR
jgi:hypothetical protein